jgi:hypothetical protein
MLHDRQHDATGSDSVSDWLVQLEAGDEAAAQRLWERYVTRLIRLASRRLGSTPRTVAASMREQLPARLAQRDDDVQRRTAPGKLAGYASAELAQSSGWSLRSVE